MRTRDQAASLFVDDLLCVLRYVAANKRMAHPTANNEPYNTVLHAMLLYPSAIDHACDWVTYITDPNDPADVAVRTAAQRLRLHDTPTH